MDRLIAVRRPRISRVVNVVQGSRRVMNRWTHRARTRTHTHARRSYADDSVTRYPRHGLRAYVMDVTCRKMTAEPGRLRVDESGMGKSTCLKVTRHYARIE